MCGNPEYAVLKLCVICMTARLIGLFHLHQ